MIKMIKVNARFIRRQRVFILFSNALMSTQKIENI